MRQREFAALMLWIIGCYCLSKAIEVWAEIEYDKGYHKAVKEMSEHQDRALAERMAKSVHSESEG